MGRELRRKQAKRDGKNVREVQKQSKDKPLSPKAFIGILVLLLLLFVVLYILTGIFVTKEIKWFDKKDKDSVTEIENKILAIDSLKQNDMEYYVYFYNSKEEDETVSNVLSMLLETVYRVDLNDDFNSNFIGEPSGIVDNIKDLKVSDPTVIRVSGEEIQDFYSGKEEIKEKLN